MTSATTDRADATYPLGEGERLRITQQVDVRLVAATERRSRRAPFRGSSIQLYQKDPAILWDRHRSGLSRHVRHVNTQPVTTSPAMLRYAASRRSPGDSQEWEREKSGTKTHAVICDANFKRPSELLCFTVELRGTRTPARSDDNAA